MLFHQLLSIVNKVFPKSNKIIFNSFPNFSGNSLALYQYICQERKDITSKYTLIWTVSGNELGKVPQFIDDGTKIVKKSSLRGAIAFISAKYIFSTHGYFNGIACPRRQINFNLWHGMPFKKIGKTVNHENGKFDDAYYTIATSDYYQNIMADSFEIPPEKVYVTGQPCNDVLLKENDYLYKLHIDKKKYEKIFVWMPTYRKSIVGDIRNDGKFESFGVVSIFSDHLRELNEELIKLNYLLIVKPHPMDAINQLSLDNTSNIQVIKNSDLEDNEVQLYGLLSESTNLITDYSSVFIDYMITGKPIAFTVDDIQEYSSTRGFYVDNPLSYMPGYKIKGYDELVDYIKNCDTIDNEYKKDYEQVNKKFNKYRDSEASKRLTNLLFGEKLS